MRWKETSVSWMIYLCCFVTVAYAAHDPTEPANLNSINIDAPFSIWKLQAIYISPLRKIAIINNKIVHENDHINNYVIKKINPHSVQVKTQENELTLFLLNQKNLLFTFIDRE